MELAIACSSCGRPIPVTRADAGTLVHCPACERPTRAPALEALEPPANVARTALARTAIAPAAGAPEPDGSALSLEVARARADPAKRFGHFVLLAKLGKGGMGVVHRAWNDRLRREVALKTILAADEVDEETLRRFHREAEAVARLRHQNIVSVFEAGEIAGQHYLAMELVRGRTLEDRLRPQNDVRATTAVWNRGPARIPLNKALEALRDVARAVHYAHEQGVVHRDLKPLNIMIDESGQARVLDFGVAHVSGAGTKLTKTGGRIGTLVYMAPEQAGGAHVDARSDVYALGATLYDVLTNRPPFVGDSELQIVSALLRSEPEPPGLLNPRVAGDLETICLKCLAKEPERRYATAAALADDLDRFLAGEPIEARPLGSLGRARRWVRRNRLLAASLSVVLAVVFSSALYVLRERTRRAEAEREAAREEAARTWTEFEAGRRSTTGDRALALGLDAFQAAWRYSALSGDAEARKAAFRSACALGEVALQAEQWSVAVTAYERAARLHVDDPRAAAGLREVDARRARLQTDHRAAVAAVLSAARAGRIADFPGGRDGALFSLVRLAEPQTVSMLATELDAASRMLRETTRSLYLTSRAPDIEGAAERWRALAPGQKPDAETAAILARAGLEVEMHDDARERAGRERSFREIAASAQGASLGEARLDLAKLACEALGWIGIADGAVEPLGSYLASEEDELRAAVAAEALCRLGRSAPRAVRLAEAAWERFGVNGPFWSQVRRSYQHATGEQEPTTASGYVMRAFRRRESGDARGALEDYDRAIALDPKASHALSARAALRCDAGDMERALADLTRAIQLSPQDAELWSNRGVARERARDLDGAIADYTRALELAPRLVPALSNRSGARRDEGDLVGALADATRALELEPQNPVCWLLKADVLEKKDDLDGAISCCSRAIELDPRNAVAWNRRSHARDTRRDLDGALADATRAIELDPRPAIHWINRGHARFEKGDLQGAVADDTRAIEIDPSQAQAWSDRGGARAARGDFEKGIIDLTRAIELSPSLAYAWLNRGVARQAKGDIAGAIRDLERFLELAPQDSEAPNVKAFIVKNRPR